MIRPPTTIRQKGNAQGWSGQWVTSGILPNKAPYTIWKVVRAGGRNFRLQVRGTRRCKGISSWNRCWGTVLESVSHGERRFDLRDTLVGHFRPALQEKVTAACVSRIGDRGRLEDVVRKHRDDAADRESLDLFDDASQHLMSDLGRLARHGADDVCKPRNEELIAGMVARSVRRAERNHPAEALKEALEIRRRDLQETLDRLVRTLVETHTVGERFGEQAGTGPAVPAAR